MVERLAVHLVTDKCYAFQDALYGARCPACDEKLEWEADFDADGTTHNTTCCDKMYILYPETVRVEVLAVEADGKHA